MVFTFSDTSVSAGIEIAEIMLSQTGVSIPQLIGGSPATFTVLLEGGLDGYWPMASDYQGSEDPSNPQSKTGLKALEDVTEVSVVAMPGSTYMAGGDPTQEIYQQALAAQFYLITHCETMAYRIAVLDSPDNYSVSQVSAWRGQIDSSYAALYYPWVKIADPTANATSTNTEIILPPCGFVAGIYARNDAENGAQKAPANEVVTDALSFELLLNKGQQDILNPLGVNCFRYFPNRGYLLWGARTATSDTEWQYVNLRRYMNYLKASIDAGTQYVVFENNGQQTWASVQQIVTDFLYNEFVNGALFGSTQAQAFFVRCDQTTMTQNDIDNGRLVCLIGVALLRPAEFVIFRIGQFTASSSSAS
jgi:phage tail sheath protein FI